MLRRLPGALVALLLVTAPLDAQAPARAGARSFAGFNVSYVPPAGWTLQQQQGRAHAWTDASRRALLFAGAGSFSTLELAFADVAVVQNLLRNVEPEPFEGPWQRAMGPHRVMGAAVRASSDQGETVVLRGVTVLTAHGTALGFAIVVEGARDAEARRILEALVASVTAAPPVENRALAARLAGTWRSGSGYTSNSGGGGGMTSEETWTFDPSGRFAHRATSVVSMPGVAIEPKDERVEGRWRVIGEGRTTMNLAFDGGAVRIDDVRYLPLR